VIELVDVSFRYGPEEPFVLRGASLEIPPGELAVVVGPTGSGKSTVLELMCGLVPHFSGGQISGEVRVGGRSVLDAEPASLAGAIGYVGQDPPAGFVTDRVEDEIAYAMENLGVDPTAMRRRVEDALDLLDLHELRRAPLRTLSGGQAQRVAIASVLAAMPQVLVFDEPTSALDPSAAEDVLSSLARLVHDLDLTVVIAEHRLERVLPFAERVVALDGRGGLVVGEPAAVMADAPLAPPIVELGRLAGWAPLPLTVRAARRMATELSARLGPLQATTAPEAPGASCAEVAGAGVSFGPFQALQQVDLLVGRSSVTALMGRNGAGKSTLLGLLAGERRPDAGWVSVEGRDPEALDPAERIGLVGFVPQVAGDLLYAQSVAEECATADREHHLAPGTTRAVLVELVGEFDDATHPRDLSEGQRLALALSVVMAPAPELLLLDEPTRGLDYCAKLSLIGILDRLRGQGCAVVLATHDVELVAQVADRAVVLAEGEVIADGPARQVICHTPAFAPQVAKVLRPLDFVTVAEVAEALG
jgi:energy-coupling factor transport system ATP-binding protein